MHAIEEVRAVTDILARLLRVPPYGDGDCSNARCPASNLICCVRNNKPQARAPEGRK